MRRRRNSSCRPVFIVHSAWHAAIVLRKGDIPSDGRAGARVDFPSAQFVEFSWGDKDYFPNPDAGVFAGLKAAFWSSGSVVHVVGLSGDWQAFYAGAAIIELRLVPAAYGRLLDFCLKNFFAPGAGVSRSSLPRPFRPQLFLSRHAQVQPSKDLQRLGCRSARVSGPADRAQLCDHSGSARRTDRQA